MLREKLKGTNIILASGSPRRQQFFRDLDLGFEIRLREVDEVFPEHLQGVEITDFLAKLKADAFEGSLKNGDLLITSDTLVWHDGRALGKPIDKEDAIRILQSLSGNTHDVFTSVCFKTTEKCEIINDRTRVTFAPLGNDAIEYYLERHKPYDKAGAYGIQDWIGYVAVTSIEGSYTNVMGLPVAKVFEFLNRFAKK